MASDDEIEKTQEERKRMEKQLASLTSVTFDTDLYGGTDKGAYVSSIPVNDDDDNAEAMDNEIARRMAASYTAPKSVLNERPRGGDADEDLGFKKPQRIIDREDDYRQRRLNRIISPERHDPFASGEKTPDPSVRTYADVMREEALKREKDETLKLIAKKMKEKEEAPPEKEDKPAAAEAAPQKRRNRWDQSQDGDGGGKKVKTSDWDLPDTTPGKWDATPTPGRVSDSTPSLGRRNRWDETPTPGRVADSDATPAGAVTPGATPAGMAWDATPKLPGMATPTPKRQRSRWDETPASMGSATPMAGATPAAAYTPGVTPVGGVELATPTPGAINVRGAITPEQYNLLRWEKDIEERNRPLTDEELDAMFPQEGYKVLDPPSSYVPIRTPARKLLATPTPMGTPMYSIPEENRGQQFDVPKELPGGLPFMKPEDYQYFGALLNEDEEEELSPDEQKERKIMKLLLKVKNGTPQQRKTALRQLTDKAREFGAGPLFNRILPLLMQPTLEDQERHLLVKVIDRVLYKLDELVRPYVHKILVVIEPLLIDEDYYARVEGREIISNLSKAAGLATMIAAMRPDIDNIDEYVRNTTARAFSVVASALGIPALLPFLKAVCQSKKSWQARHTGIKIVQQIAILIGCAVLPHLRSLVEIIENGLSDENQKVRTITALSLAALAEAAAPYGIESFDSVLKPLWKGTQLRTRLRLSTDPNHLLHPAPLYFAQVSLSPLSLSLWPHSELVAESAMQAVSKRVGRQYLTQSSSILLLKSIYPLSDHYYGADRPKYGSTLATKGVGHLVRKGTGGRSSVSGIVAAVFGSTGFLGRYLVQQLAKMGSQVLVPFRGSEDSHRHLKLMGDLGQIVPMKYNPRDEDSIKAVMAKANVVINLIGRDYETRNFSFEEVNHSMAQQLATISKEHGGIMRFIQVSCLGASSSSPSRFLRTKAAAEEAVLSELPEATILRPAVMVGTEDRILNRWAFFAKKYGFLPLIGDGSTKFQPVYVVDVAGAIVAALKDDGTSMGKVYELGGPEIFTMHQLAELMFDTIREWPRYVKVPLPIAKAMGAPREILLNKVPFPLPNPEIFNRDQILAQATDTLVSENALTFNDLGLVPHKLKGYPIEFLIQFRKGGPNYGSTVSERVSPDAWP